jgi:hypothetical protein
MPGESWPTCITNWEMQGRPKRKNSRTQFHITNNVESPLELLASDDICDVS